MSSAMPGLCTYTGGTSKDELLDELLYQRRYSLYGRIDTAVMTGSIDRPPL